MNAEPNGGVQKVAQDLDVIVHGTCTTDILFSGLSKLPLPGEEVYSRQFAYAVGGSFITAAALARLGIRVGVVCPLGTDDFSKFIRDTLQAESIASLAFEANQSQANVSVCMNLPDDRAIVSYSDEVPSRAFIAHSVETVRNASARILHISACEGAAPIISEAHASGMYVSMDVAWSEDWLRSESALTIIRESDLFIPNEREACTITGTGSAEEAIRVLRQHIPNVVIKCGEHGALCWGKDAPGPCKVPGLAVSSIVDTTGAGDNFDAGVLYGVLQHLDLYKSAMLGNFCGSTSVQGIGGTDHIASYEQVEAYLNTISEVRTNREGS